MWSEEKLKDGGRASWGILLSELKHKASDMHKKVGFIG